MQILHPRIQLAALLGASLLLLCLFAAPARAAQVGVVADVTWGQSRGDIDREISMLQAAGVQWIRANVNWKGLEADGKGQINDWLLREYDYAVDRAHAAGIQVLMPISDGVPYWASGDPAKSGGDWDDRYPPANMADYGDFVRFVAGHYRPKGVRVYEIWNEQNLEWFWSPAPDPVRYTQMLEAGYGAVKAADPGATVLFGGVSENDFEYLEAVYRAGGGRFFDAVAVHPYTQLAPETEWKGANSHEDPNRISRYAFPGLKEVKATMDAFGDSHKKVWITEFGYTTYSDGVTEQEQADYLTRAYAYVERLPWVEALFWYQARDNPFYEGSDDHEARFGLTTWDWQPKPSYHALKAYTGGRRPPGTSSAASGAPHAGLLPAPSVAASGHGGSRSGGAARAARRSARVRGRLPRGEHVRRVRLQLERRTRGRRPGWKVVMRLPARVRRSVYERSIPSKRLRRGRARVRAVATLASGARVSRYRYFSLR